MPASSQAAGDSGAQKCWQGSLWANKSQHQVEKRPRMLVHHEPQGFQALNPSEKAKKGQPYKIPVGRRPQVSAKQTWQPNGRLLQEDQVEVEPENRQTQPQAAILDHLKVISFRHLLLLRSFKAISPLEGPCSGSWKSAHWISWEAHTRSHEAEAPCRGINTLVGPRVVNPKGIATSPDVA